MFSLALVFRLLIMLVGIPTGRVVDGGPPPSRCFLTHIGAASILILARLCPYLGYIVALLAHAVVNGWPLYVLSVRGSRKHWATMING